MARLEGSRGQSFGIGRALGLGFKAWFANFIPVTLIAAVLYAPIIIWATMLPGVEALGTRTATSVIDSYVGFIQHGTIALVGISALLSPLFTYRVVQWMNGRKTSIGLSFKFGLRGIIPAAILAAATYLLGLVPFGGILAAVITCIWFVAAPAAVAEKLHPGRALARSATLTEGRRGGIFLLNLVMTISIIAVLYAVVSPLLHAERMEPTEVMATLKRTVYVLIGLICGFQILSGMVQAVSYSLLRTDKDGVSNEELASVFA